MKTKHTIGMLIVLLVFPLLFGCGNSTPAGAGGKPTPAARNPEGLDERHANNYLSGAKHLQEIGEPEQAVATLKELIANYPESDAAGDAKQILSKLEMSNVKEGKD